MPDWFRDACRWLWRPEQCVECGTVREDGRYIRGDFVAYCSVTCAMAARQPCRVL